MEEKSREMVATPDSSTAREDMERLRATRDKLNRQRALLDEKLHGGHLLSTSEERR